MFGESHLTLEISRSINLEKAPFVSKTPLGINPSEYIQIGTLICPRYFPLQGTSETDYCLDRDSSLIFQLSLI